MNKQHQQKEQEQPQKMSHQVHPYAGQRCILRLPDVIRLIGYKRSHIYNLMREGKFPQSIKIGIRAVGWDSEDIKQWINEQLGQR